MSIQLNHKFFLLIVLIGLVISCKQKSEKQLYSFGPELQTLSQDLESLAYKDVVKTMIFQDLREEWKRVATPDNYIVFREVHGGMEIIKADSQLLNAYNLRIEIAERFIAFMEDEIRKKTENRNLIKNRLSFF